MAQPEDTVRKKPRDTEPQGFFLINLNLTYEKTITMRICKLRAIICFFYGITYFDCCTGGGPDALPPFSEEVPFLRMEALYGWLGSSGSYCGTGRDG